MAKRAAITNAGKKAEDHFIKLVTGARRSDLAKHGDVVMTVDGDTAYVEIKACRAELGGGTINQVRAIKYICCVIWAPKHRCWYVISPDQLVRLAAKKNRGQHTEIPFECMTLSLNKRLPKDLYTKCTDQQLATTVEGAIRRGRENVNLHDMMCRLLVDIESIKERYLNEVNRQ